jgi:hypothetical protein
MMRESIHIAFFRMDFVGGQQEFVCERHCCDDRQPNVVVNTQKPQGRGGERGNKE